MFTLDERLEKDCIVLGDLVLSRVLLMNDANYPWVILVPRRENVSDMFDLSEADQQQLLIESSKVGSVLKREFKADKMNMAALGNVVHQLHVHHIVRYKTDASWPKPVWGFQPAKPYTETELQQIVARLKTCLGLT